MNCWEVLEIEPTTDEREIRRAYAKKLKVTRPDDDPTGYQVLILINWRTKSILRKIFARNLNLKIRLIFSEICQKTHH